MSDVVVIAYRLPQINKLETMKKTNGPVRSSQAMPGDSFGTPASANQAIAVNATADNPANDAAVVEAAERLAGALLDLKEILKSFDPATDVTIESLKITVKAGDLLKDLDNTKFTVTDRSYNKNKGVGSAVRGNPNMEEINYAAITGPDGYGAERFPRNSGLVGIMLHELGHISAAGDGFWRSSQGYHKKDPVLRISSFYNTEYATNLERFANNFMDGVATGLNIDLHGLVPGGYRGKAVDPSAIYNSHVPPGKQE